MAGYDDFSSPVSASAQAPATGYDAFSSPVAAAPEETGGEHAAGAARSALGGLTFGFGDELEAGVRSLFEKGGTRGYKDTLKNVRGQQKQYEERHPYESTALNLAGAVPTVFAGGAALKALPYLGRAAAAMDAIPGFVPRAAAKGAAAGAPYGAIQGVGSAEDISTPEEYLKAAGEGAKQGAIAGAVLTPAITGAGRAVASAVAPWTTAASQKLIDAGVPTTIGETLGGGGAGSGIVGRLVNATEGKLTSLPLAGEAVRAAKIRSREGLNRLAADEVLKPIGEKIAPGSLAGRNLIQETEDIVGNRLGRVYAKANAKLDSSFDKAVADIRKKVPADRQGAFDDAVMRNIKDVADGNRGVLSGDAFQQAASGLKGEAAGLASAGPSHYDRMLGRQLFKVHDELLDLAARQGPPELAKEIRDASKAYAGFKRMQRAASSVAADQGVFTPAQLHNAVKALDKSAGKGAFARGDAMLQDLSETAKSVMTEKIPDSGTAGRLALPALFHYATSGTNLLPHLAAEGGIGALYSKPAQAAFRKLAAGNPQARRVLADLIRKHSEQYSVPLAVAAGTQQ